MAKFMKYVSTGLFIAYALHGGCDTNIDDVLKEKYSTPVIAARKALVDFASRKACDAYNAVEIESKNLESRMDSRGGRK